MREKGLTLKIFVSKYSTQSLVFKGVNMFSSRHYVACQETDGKRYVAFMCPHYIHRRRKMKGERGIKNAPGVTWGVRLQTCQSEGAGTYRFLILNPETAFGG